MFAALGAALLALQSSMQHEFIHGHPTAWRRLNRALGAVPLTLWLPFESYRRTHLVHHCDERLTDPFDDPETQYWTAEDWTALGPLGRAFIMVHSTLAGRLVFGPAWNIGRYLANEAKALAAGDRATRRIWIGHALSSAVVLAWVVGVCGIDPLFYLCALVYPAASILLLRSFAEHRAEAGIFERTAIVENAPILGFLFLYNNLHAAHHERPLIPWYELPGLVPAQPRPARGAERRPRLPGLCRGGPPLPVRAAPRPGPPAQRAPRSRPASNKDCGRAAPRFFTASWRKRRAPPPNPCHKPSRTRL